MPLLNGALGSLQRLAPLQGTDTWMGREDSIYCLSNARPAKVLEVTQAGAKATLKLQLL